MTAGLGELTCLLRTAVTAPTAVRAFRLSTQGEPHQPSLPHERRVAVGQDGPRVGWTCGRERRDRRIPKDTGIEPVRVQGEHAFVELLRAGAASGQSTRVGQMSSGGLDFRRSIERARILVAGDHRRRVQRAHPVVDNVTGDDQFRCRGCAGWS